MKKLITAVPLILVLMLASAISMEAQTITGKFSNEPLPKVLEKIEAQTGYTFMYDIGAVKGITVTASFDKADVGTVLSRILGPTLRYTIKRNLITISERPAQSSAPAREHKSEPAPPVTEQLLTVKGIVRDTEGPLGGVAIVPDDNRSGAVISDLDGRFSIRVRPGTKLGFSCIGYSTQYKTVDSPADLKIFLNEEMQMIDEVVVVGYGVQQKESTVGAISQIRTDDLVRSGQTNVTQAIAGKLSGVLTMASSGQPGSNDTEILVRGVSSWNGSSPLVMVDGVERTFTEIDPNEIETISVLKDASATAVFGAKGANGVILVTTRTGAKSEPKMKFSYSHGFLFPALLPEHQGAYDVASAYNVAMMNMQNYSSMFTSEDLEQYKSPSDKYKAFQYPDVDWYDTMLRKVAHTTDANFNISGGTDKTRYFISMGYKHEGSIFKTFRDFDKVTYSFDRLNYRANLDFNLTKTTTLTYKVGGDIGVTQEPDDSPITAMYSGATISFPAYYPEWVLEEIPDWDYPNASGMRLVTPKYATLGSYYGSPYNCLNIASYNQSTSSRLYTDLLLKQDLGMLTNGLSVNAKLSFSTKMSRTSEKVSRGTETYFLDWGLLELGEVNPWLCSTTSTTVVENQPYSAKQGDVNSYTYTLYAEASVNYDRTFRNHHVTALVLGNRREYRSKASLPYRNQGLVGRMTYDYAHKYLFEANVGYTGSEQFAPANRYGLFPSLAFGYVVSRENWWKKNLPWWSKLKIRYSDGLVGNDQTESRWLYYSSYTQSGKYIFEESAANTAAQWETAHKQDIGIEMAWLKDRLSLEVDLFKEHRDHMLITPVVTYLVGNDSKEVNKGEMKKHGFEIELGWKDKFKNGLSYNVHGMISFNENRIINYEDAPYLPDYQKKAGKPHKGKTDGMTTVDTGYYTSVNDIHTYPSYTDNWVYLNVGSYKYLDYSSDGVLNADDLHSVQGSQYPSTLMSFGGGFEYKGWFFSYLFYGNLGKWVNYNASFEMDFTKGEMRLSKTEADYWRPDNQDANHATIIYSGSAGHPMYSWAGISSGTSSKMGLVGRTWRNANYFTLKDIYLGYTFDTATLSKLVGIRSLSLYLSGNNLLYFTNLPEGNPEVSSLTTGYYPLMKTVQIGLKAGF